MLSLSSDAAMFARATAVLGVRPLSNGRCWWDRPQTVPFLVQDSRRLLAKKPPNR